MSQLFVSTINLRNRSRQAIDAGQTFEKGELVPNTFKELCEKGFIKEYAPGIVLVGVRGAAGGKRLVGPPLNTPVDAVHPPKSPEINRAENRSPEQEVERQGILAKLRGMGVWVQNNMRLDTAKVKLAEEEAKKVTAQKTKPERVWDFDPSRLTIIADERLQAMYKERCAKHDLEVESITDRDLLIAKMSSEHAL